MSKLSKAIRYLYTQYQAEKKLQGKVFSKYHQTLNLNISQEYFITSEKGLFWITKNKIEKIFDAWCFGVAVQGNMIFLSCSNNFETYVLKGELVKTKNKYSIRSTQKIYSEPITVSNRRIHQICIYKDVLYVANTVRNTILYVATDTGETLKEIAPFKDLWGEPILYDQNHINSIFATENHLFFIAYRVGSGSAIGLIDDQLITLYSYKNKGVHDIYLSKKRFLFSDTFGEQRSTESGGALIMNGEKFDESFFAKPPGYIVRGFAGTNEEMIVGHSHKGERKKRFEGFGKLLISDTNSVKDVIDFPASQVYDIISIDGVKFTEDTFYSKNSEVHQEIQNILGEPLHKMLIQDHIL